MLYTDNKEIYIKVSGYFIKVDVKKDKQDEYNIIPDTTKQIEMYGNEDKFYPVSVDKAYEILSTKNKFRYKLEEKLENK